MDQERFSVLYIDDEESLLDITKQFLERLGSFRVDTLTSASDAILKLNYHRYDCILSDYQMPGMDGIQLLQALRSQGHTLPFILFTGKGREDVVINALNNGADYYIQKGGDPRSLFAELEHVISTAIERSKTARALLETQKCMADIINFLPDGTFAIDNDGQVVAWNKALEKMTGVPQDSIIGKGNQECSISIYGENRPILADILLNKNNDLANRYSFLKWDGDRINTEMFAPNLYNGKGAHIWFSASTLYDTNNNVIGAIEVIRDISDYKSAEERIKETHSKLQSSYEQLAAAEEELRQNYAELSKTQEDLSLSEERYRTVVEDQTEFICRFSPTGELTFVNEAYCRYFNLDIKSCLGEHQSVEIPPEDRLMVRHHLRSLTPENPVGIIEHRIIMPSGEIRWQRWSDRAIFDTQGTIREFQSVGRDTTEKREAEERLKSMHAELHASYEQLAAAEEELRQNYAELSKSQEDLSLSEERYRTVVEDQTEFICRFTPSGELTFVNEAYCRYFNLNKQSCLGKPHSVKIHPDDLQIVSRHISSLTPDHPVDIIEHRIVMPSGEIRWQRWSDRAIFDTEGTIREFQSVGRDTTDKQEAEKRLKTMHAELHASYEQLAATEEELRQNYSELAYSQGLLRQREEQYRTVVEDQTEFICRFSPSGKLTFVNDAYCRYFNLNKQSCLGKPHSVIIPSDDIPMVRQHLQSLTPDHPVDTIEHRIIMPSGEIRWQRWSDRAIFDTDGTIIEFQSVGRDTTEKRQDEEKLKSMHLELYASYEQLAATEEELRQNYSELTNSQDLLRQSEERYRSVVEDQTEFICRFKPSGELTFVNEAYCRYFKLDKNSCLGKQHPVIIHPEDLPAVKLHLELLTPEHPVEIIEHRIVMPSGEIKWQRWSDRAIFDTEGTIIEFQSVGRDTTEKREDEEKLKTMHTELHASYEQLAATEEELRQNYSELANSQEQIRQSEERFRSVVEDQTEFICRFSPSGELTFVNEAYCRYFKLDKNTCIGNLHQVIIHPEDIRMMQQHLWTLTPDHPVASIEHRIILPGGDVRWQRWSDHGIFDSNGTLIEYQSVGLDITDQKRNEQALFNMNKKLNLLSTITRHDILNQLTVLQLSLETIGDMMAVTGELAMLFDKAVQSSRLIESYIYFTQKYQDLGLTEPSWQNPYAYIINVRTNDGYSRVDVDKSLMNVEIFTDSFIWIIFSNLFENSVRHGGSVSRIAVHGEVTPESYILSVEDDGEGIKPDEKKKIFQKGYGKHTGLGLFLVHELLATTGISIRETGEYKKGARFEITIPKGLFRFVINDEKRIIRR
jgi:PAS domain S-box-containing protein